MAPVYLFDYINAEKDVVVLGFTLAFGLFLALLTTARRHEIFAAMAA